MARSWGYALAVVLATAGFTLGGLQGLAARQQALARQQQRGARAFRAMCETCHGPQGNGAGGAPNLNHRGFLQQYTTATALAHFIQQRMPASDPGILTPAQAQDLAQYLRGLNRFRRST